MKKNIILGLSTGLALLSLAACTPKENAATKTNTDTTPTTTTEVTPATGTDPIITTGITPTTTTGVTPTTTEKPFTKVETTVYVVGDSTLCSFNDGYMYPRYGYGTQLATYLDDNEYALVKNLALSGRSSLSFLSENNYTTLKNSIDEGDYLVIGFGHNDEKSDDSSRFRNANYANIEAALADEDSFQRSLYDNYVKLALDAGATPILASPIVRLNKSDDYSGTSAHKTSTGDYAKAVRELADYYDVAFVDMTEITKAEYTKLGYDEAIYYHAMTAGRYTDESRTEIEPKLTTVDATHLNVYGAKFAAYSFVEALKNTNCNLKYYANPENTKPTKDEDLVMNPNYKPLDYAPINWASLDIDEVYGTYAANYTTYTTGIYGTAFGDLGGTSKVSNMIAKETITDNKSVFTVGNSETKNGKLTATSAGFALAFMQIPSNKNYSLEATATVKEYVSTTQAGFGLMIRDDCYVPTHDASIVSNCICAGLNTIASSQSSAVNFGYENNNLFTTDYSTSIYGVDTVCQLKITRLGQNITISTTIGANKYENTYYDFDILDVDNNYYYLGMFATRGTVVDFSDVKFTYLSDYEGA